MITICSIKQRSNAAFTRRFLYMISEDFGLDSTEDACYPFIITFL